MILQVFNTIGTKLTINNAYTQLLALYSNELYPEKKAAGCLGGAVNAGTIVLVNGIYERIK